MTTTARERLAVVAALTSVQLFFGLHYLAAKLVLLEIPPRAWALVRVGCAALVLAAVAAGLRRPWPRPRTWAALAGCAFFGVVVNQLCFIEGLSRTTVTHSALINTTIPVWTLVFAVLFGRERAGWRKAAAIALSLAGVLLVLRPWAVAAPDAGSTLAGDLLTVTNAASYAFFLVISKRVLAGQDAVTATAVLLFWGTLGIALVGAPAAAAIDVGALSPRTIWLGAFIVVFATVGTYLLNYAVLRRAEPSLVALFTYLQPLVAAALAWIVLGERPGLAVWAGAALVFAGVGLALTRRS